MTVKIMGIVNMTPNSFYDGGRYNDVDHALRHIETLIQDGADIIDVGGESTRPGADEVTQDEELARIVPLLERYTSHFDTPLSLDTRRSDVAKIGLELGATFINDVGGLQEDEAMAGVIAQYDATAIVMHRKGIPKTMQDNPHYDDVIHEINIYLRRSLALAKNAGIDEVIVDPGIGFGKTLAHNLSVLHHLDAFADLQCPILIGTSNKSFIGKLTGAPVEDRLPETLISTIMAVQKGATICRVHNVNAMKRALDMMEAIHAGL